MVLNEDRYGWFLQCLQCAHIVDLDICSATTPMLSKRVSKRMRHGNGVGISMRK